VAKLQKLQLIGIKGNNKFCY